MQWRRRPSVFCLYLTSLNFISCRNVFGVRAVSVEVEVVVGEERPRVVTVSTAVCLTLEMETIQSILIPSHAPIQLMLIMTIINNKNQLSIRCPVLVQIRSDQFSLAEIRLDHINLDQIRSEQIKFLQPLQSGSDMSCDKDEPHEEATHAPPEGRSKNSYCHSLGRRENK